MTAPITTAEEMREAAALKAESFVISEDDEADGILWPRDIPQKIAAAIRALPVVPVAVKPLEWQKGPFDYIGRAGTEFEYVVRNLEWPGDGEKWGMGRRGFGWQSGYPTLDLAKAAAQADYETRIRSALSSTAVAASPAPDAGDKVQSLIKQLDGLCRDIETGQPLYDDAHVDLRAYEAREIIAALRAIGGEV